MENSFSIIEKKLKIFKKKYYLKILLEGFIIWIIFNLIFLLLILGLEYILFFNIIFKKIIILFILLSFFFSFLFLLLIPILKLFGLLKKLSKEKICEIVVKHFPEIKDKLLNIIELKEESNINIYSEELIYASIDQKILDIKKFSFNESINFKEKISIFYYFFLINTILILILIISPNFLKETAFRIINYEKTFEKPSPYNFKILNENLNVGKCDDFLLRVNVEGKFLVDPLYIKLGGKEFLMKNDSIGYYSYLFNNLNNDLHFQFSIKKFQSKYFLLDVLEKPILNKFISHLKKPEYTLLKDEEYENVTDFFIPEGTIISFDFFSSYTDSLILVANNSKIVTSKNIKTNSFKYSNLYKQDNLTSVFLINSFFKLNDFLRINIKTIRDEYPTISVQNFSDTIDFTKVYFKGLIGDDYGFTKLLFIIKNDDKIDTTLNLNIIQNSQDQEFYFAFDFNEYKDKFNSLNYNFEIFDNDQVNGIKSAISEVFYFNFPNEDEILKQQNNNIENIQKIISNSMNLTDQLKNDLFEVNKKMINSDLSEWERKEIQTNIKNKKENIENEIKKLQEKSEEINNYLSSFSNQDQKILEKQNQIKNLLDNVFSEELKKLFEEFNKMMQELNKEKLTDINEKLDISLDDISKQLDKNLELLRKMQIEQKLDLFSQIISKLLIEQDSLINKSENYFNFNELNDKQKKLKEKLLSAEDLYKEINNINNYLQYPINLFDFEKEFDDIKNEYSNSIENLENSNKKKSKESMNKNLENLKNFDFNIKKMLDSLFQEKTKENLSDLLQILDNLIIFSFNQEDLISSTNTNNFNAIILSRQKKLFSDFKIIEDSLYSLARREPSIDTKINLELVHIKNYNLDIEKGFEGNVISEILVNQQKVLTSVNELSLFLSEIIKQLQKNMANSMPGNQNCNKPGNNPNPNSMGSSLKGMQKSLQQQLERAMQMMKDGTTGKSINDELGKAISQQEAMHNLLQKMMNQGQVGSGAYETLKQADQLLNKTKEDILRNDISNSTIDRQKQILTRLLEAETAENEREIDQKRKSNTAINQFSNEKRKEYSNSNSLNNFEEKLIKNRLLLNTYYQKKYQKYVGLLDSINGEIYKNKINFK